MSQDVMFLQQAINFAALPSIQSSESDSSGSDSDEVVDVANIVFSNIEWTGNEKQVGMWPKIYPVDLFNVIKHTSLNGCFAILQDAQGQTTRATPVVSIPSPLASPSGRVQTPSSGKTETYFAASITIPTSRRLCNKWANFHIFQGLLPWKPVQLY